MLITSGAVACGIPYVDGTAFTADGVTLRAEAEERLKKAGYSPCGTRVMYSGVTGKKLRARVFIGPVYVVCFVFCRNEFHTHAMQIILRSYTQIRG